MLLFFIWMQKLRWSAPFNVKTQIKGENWQAVYNSKRIVMQFTEGATMISHVDTTFSVPDFQVQVLRPVNLR